MAIPIAARLIDEPLTLGTLQFRDFNQVFTATPPMGVKPFTGPLAILTDEGTASTAEILAAGLQEARRAMVVGDTTLGAVLAVGGRGAARRRGHAVRGGRLQDAQGGAAGGARRAARSARGRDARRPAGRARPGA